MTNNMTDPARAACSSAPTPAAVSPPRGSDGIDPQSTAVLLMVFQAFASIRQQEAVEALAGSTPMGGLMGASWAAMIVWSLGAMWLGWGLANGD